MVHAPHQTDVEERDSATCYKFMFTRRLNQDGFLIVKTQRKQGNKKKKDLKQVGKFDTNKVSRIPFRFGVSLALRHSKELLNGKLIPIGAVRLFAHVGCSASKLILPKLQS